jgi:signal transduction histidine kinase
MIRSVWHRSLRIRLLGGTLFWIAASIAAAGWGLGNLFRQHVETQFYAELRTHLDQLAVHLSLDERGNPQISLPLTDPRLSRPYSGYYWQIDPLGGTAGSEASGIGVLRSRSLWDYVLAVPPDSPADGEIHQHSVFGPEGSMLGMAERIVRLEDMPDGKPHAFRLIAAADENLFAEPVARFRGVLWFALGVLGAGLVIAVFVQVFVGLAPLRALQSALEKVRSGERQAIEGDFPTEVMPLIVEFNSVLSQNSEVVDRARTQAGNLAHALKTPLSVLANAAQCNDADRTELARLIADQVSVARRQVEYHMARAQVAASTRKPGVRTPLLPAIDGLVRAMSRIHAEAQIEITVHPFRDSLCFRGEAQDLQEMLGNLLDNACKWARRRVELAVQSAEAILTITIDDDGAGLAADQRALVIRRGVRADEQVPGSGLGLAIVDDLARLYGGRFALDDSPMGGLRAVLMLPAAAA